MLRARIRHLCLFSARTFAAGTIAIVFFAAAFMSLAKAAETGSAVSDFSGQWGRDMLFYEPPPSGPGPLVNSTRNADGAVVARDPCCTVIPRWIGNHTAPILKPEAAEAVKKFGELATIGTVVQDLHNSCWPEPPPYVMGMHFGMLAVQTKDELTLTYLLHNTVRRIRLNGSHPENLAPRWQGDSIGRFEGDTLVVDTVGIKVAPISIVDAFGTPHTKALHVVERYRLIDGAAAAEAQKKNGAIARPDPFYNRGAVDTDIARRGLQIAFTVDDPGVFTTPWSGQVTYRPVLGRWPESLCVENPFFLGPDAPIPTASTPDF
jgi:hypothetical protein